MPRTRTISHQGEALVLRTWPFLEADLLVSLFTRDQGVVKGVARHALRSRRRFGGALEPGTVVTAHYAERPREDLVRLDSFDIRWSPLRGESSLQRVAGLQLVVEVLEEALPEQAPEDNVYRLAVTVLQAMEDHPVWMPLTYFCVWMCRLLGWWPALAQCSVCGVTLRGVDAWWSPATDAVTCVDDRRPQGRRLSAQGIDESVRLARSGLGELMERPEAQARALWEDLGAFALGMLERHLQRRLRSGASLMP